MHFAKTVLLTVTLLAAALSSTATAQWVEDASSACQSCLLTARNAQVPSCEDIPADPRGEKDSKMPLAARICQCGAAESDAWIQTCSKPKICDVITTNVLKTAYGGIRIGCAYSGHSTGGDKDAVAPPTTSSTTTAPTTSGPSSPAPTNNGASLLLMTKSSVAVAGMTFVAAGAFAALL